MDDIRKKELWDKCVAFHGHACGGLAIGWQASLYAMELVDADFAHNEEIVCLAENDACGIDAVQAALGCTLGKGNLLIRLRGKQAFNFYNRANGKAVRLVLRDTPEMSRDERRHWLMTADYHEVFDVKAAREEAPERSRIFKSEICAKCGERVAESYARIHNGETVCLDCYPDYWRIGQ